MKVHIKNLGAIKEGEMEIKPLTLLCGANNTSKTYALYVVYGLLKNAVAWNMEKWEPLKSYEGGTLTFELDKFIEEHWQKFQTKISTQTTASLSEFFAADKGNFSESRVGIKFDLQTVLAAAKQETISIPASRKASASSQRTLRSPVVRIQKKKDQFAVNITCEELDPDGPPFEQVRRTLSRRLSDLVWRLLIGRDALLLPAERGGLHLFRTELNANRTHLLHRSSNPQQTLFDDIASYAQPIADYIDLLNAFESLKRNEGQLADLATWLQNYIVGGQYAVSESGTFQFQPNDVGHSLNLHLSSSTAKSYFGLWFYLKHLGEPGDVLMIDEPELNLHPDNQRRIARLLTMLVNRGVWVVLSTHSDYIVRELNNLIILSNEFEGRDRLQKEYGYQPNDQLDPDKVAAYCFAQQGEKKGVAIVPMEIDASLGIKAETFDRVINDLNNSSYELAVALAESRSEEGQDD